MRSIVSVIILLATATAVAAVVAVAAADEAAAKPAAGAAAVAASTDRPPEWLEIPHDQPVPQGSHVRMDLSNGKRWINVAALHASGASAKTHDPQTHDHDYDTKHSTAAVESPAATAAGTGAAVGDGHFEPAAADGTIPPARRSRAVTITAAHNLTANEVLAGSSVAATAADLHAAAKHAGAPSKQLDHSNPEHDPHANNEAEPEVGPGGPRVANKALDDMIAHGLFHASSRMDDDFTAMRAKVAVISNAASSQSVVESTLEDLEDLLHDRENAIEFATPNSLAKAGSMFGLTALLRIINDTEPVARARAITKSATEAAERGQAGINHLRRQIRAAKAIGTAAQNNDKVQTFAIAEGAVAALTKALGEMSRIVMNKVKLPDGLVPAAVEYQSRILYALSALLRASAPAKQQFDQNRGAGELEFLLEFNTHNPAPTQKAASLLRDILSDAQFDPTFSYAPLINNLKSRTLCEGIARAFPGLKLNPIREQFLHVMHLYLHANGCRKEFTAAGVVDEAERLALEWDTALHRRVVAGATDSTPASSSHTHLSADFEDENAYELELYHLAQAFLDASRHTDSLHSHTTHDAYDSAIGQTTTPPQPTAALPVPPSAGSSTRGSGKAAGVQSKSKQSAKSGAATNTAASSDESDEDDDSDSGELPEYFGDPNDDVPNEKKSKTYDVDADADADISGDDEVDGDADATIDDDDTADDAEDDDDTDDVSEAEAREDRDSHEHPEFVSSKKNATTSPPPRRPQSMAV